jgi:class 3 adenylate cyclase
MANKLSPQFALAHQEISPNLFWSDSLPNEEGRLGPGQGLDLIELPMTAPSYPIKDFFPVYAMACPTCQKQRHWQKLVSPLLDETTKSEVAKAVRSGQNELSPKPRIVTVLIADISGFTGILGDQPLEQVIRLLNQFHAASTQLIERYQGEIHKFLGDGFIAVFNEARPALQAAQAIQAMVSELNSYQLAADKFTFSVRIGLDSGQVTEVTLGSARRQDRTLIGMPLNLADRLQAKTPPGQVWFTQATFEQLGSPDNYRCLGPIEIKGCQQPVVIYESDDYLTN